MSDSVRVMVVDDHEVVRRGISALIESQPDLKVVAEAASASDALASALAVRPEVVVMDVRLGEGRSGIEATREIRAQLPGTAVLILTSYADDDALLAAVLAGASGYVLKQVRSGELIRSIRAVGAGVNLLGKEQTAPVVDRLRRGKHLLRDERLSRLSPQEERVLTLIADGETNVQIAQALGLAEKTVKNYVSSVLSKLEVGRRAEAAVYLVTHSAEG